MHRISLVSELFNVVHHAIKLPLAIDLGCSAQRKSVESLIAAQIAKHRFHGGEAAGDDLAPRIAVDLDLHPVGVDRSVPSITGFSGCRR